MYLFLGLTQSSFSEDSWNLQKSWNNHLSCYLSWQNAHVPVELLTVPENASLMMVEKVKIGSRKLIGVSVTLKVEREALQSKSKEPRKLRKKVKKHYFRVL